ncbi:MAG: hypothetical protein HY399_05630 [Elusimicrobia bacterium]|nr:hypothetical protein [Elusimicrobiota bacterium]
MKRAIVCFLAMVSAGSLCAQVPADDPDFAKQMSKVQDSVVTQANQATYSHRLLEQTLTAMNDGGDVDLGPRVVEFLRSPSIKIVFNDQPAPINFIFEEKVTVISLRKDIGESSPRYLSIYLTYAASLLMDRNYPASQEQEYMLLSRVARVWMELGGDLSKLEISSDFDGRTDEKAALSIRMWNQFRTRDSVAGVHPFCGKGTLAQALEKAVTEAQDTEIKLNYYGEMHVSKSEADLEKKLDSSRKQADQIRKAQAEFQIFRQQEADWFLAHHLK